MPRSAASAYTYSYSPIFIAALLIVVSCWPLTAQESSSIQVTEAGIKEDLKLAPCKQRERLAVVKSFLKKMGAVDDEISAEKTNDIQNVVITKKGKTDEVVIVGAHYDKVSAGCGAIDNWTGIVMIGYLFRTLRDVETEKTYKFVAFDREETGLEGSGEMARSITKEQKLSYCSMVNLDSFGFGYPQVLGNASNSRMTAAAKALADELKMPFSATAVPGADGDSTSFNRKDIPAITFHGLSDDWQKYLHSSNDKVENVNPGSVRVGFNFVLEYLKRIDAGSCKMFRKQ